MEPTQSAAKQQDSVLRARAAASYVSREVVQATPEHASEVIQLLVEDMLNEEEYVHSLAIEALGQVLKAAPQLAEQVLKGTLVNKANKNGTTPLHVAARKGHQEEVAYLVGEGSLGQPGIREWHNPAPDRCREWPSGDGRVLGGGGEPWSIRP